MSGYIGTQPVPQATQTRQTFTATASQTSFATGGYQAGYLDVFLNGVKLVDGTDYTATNGSDVVLTTGAASGDTLEVVAYTAFEVLNQNFTGGVTVDNDAATVLTVDRATSDGTIIDVQKNGSTVGSIGAYANEYYYGSAVGGDTFLRHGYSGIVPATSSGTNRDAAIQLGSSVSRFKDLYLSGGVYLGGTGSANKLDDYEEGTWTPTIFGTSSGSLTLTAAATGKYVKIGRFVQASVFQLEWTANSGLTGLVALGGLPFVSDYNRYSGGAFGGSSYGSMSFTGRLDAGLDPSTSTAYVMYRENANNTYSHYPTFSATGVIYGFTISYQTDA